MGIAFYPAGHTAFRLQMREGGTSHKKNSCRFHDLSKTKEGAMIKSMNQVHLYCILIIIKES